jgi:hypothetical protein
VSQCPTDRSAIEKQSSARPKTSSTWVKWSPPISTTLWNSTQISASSISPISSELSRSRAKPTRYDRWDRTREESTAR